MFNFFNTHIYIHTCIKQTKIDFEILTTNHLLYQQKIAFKYVLTNKGAALNTFTTIIII